MAEVEEHEHKSSGIAKAGLVTGIIGSALGGINSMANGAGLLGLGGAGSNKQQEKIDALRDENLLLKATALTNEKSSVIEIKLAEVTGELNSLKQALQFEGTQRVQGDAMVRQYVDDNFIKADKCVPAAKLNPPCVAWGTGLPSYAQPIFAPIMPWGPFPPVVPPTQNGGTATQSNSGSGTTTP